MTAFTYEEQGDKRYLVYEKKPEDSLDRLTLEMISNNKIKGLAPANHIQVDDSLYMKYDVTGCRSLREFLQGTVKRHQLLGIMEAVADTVMEAEDYMLNLSSYVLDADHMYMDHAAEHVLIVVLPIRREEVPLEKFLKELLMSVQYDQAEDCGYVAALISFFSSPDLFSVCALKEQIARLKEEKSVQKKPAVQKTAVQKPVQKEVKKQSNEKHKINPISIKASHDPEKQNCLDILFSEEEEEKSLKEKIGQLFKREKQEKDAYPEEDIREKTPAEKEEKKGFFGKKSEKKKKEKSRDADCELPGIAIPGMEIPVRPPKERHFEEPKKTQPFETYQKQEIPIPAQRMSIKQIPAEEIDLGETAYLSEEDEETEFLGQNEGGGPRFSLYRCSTGETFPVCGDMVRIGRSPTIAEICITGNKCVGRIHAILYVRNGQVFIEDNHSKNFTYVDGTPLDPGEPPVRLDHESEIRLGDEKLEFRIE